MAAVIYNSELEIYFHSLPAKNINRICLRALARSISTICIVNKTQAIKNSVAGLLPRYKIIIAEVCDKINTLYR